MRDRLSFSGLIQLAWDSTSLSTFLACPRKYFYSILSERAERSESVHLTFGIAYHRAMEKYNYLRAEALGRQEKITPEVQQQMVDETFQFAHEITEGWRSDDSYKNRGTLLRSVVWALAEYAEDLAETIILANGKPAVELSFRFNLDLLSPTGEPYMYCGHLDRVATFLGDTYVFDYKSTKSALTDNYWAQFSPNNQMTGYTFGGKVTQPVPVKGVMVEACQVLVNGNRYARRPTSRTETQLSEWLTNTQDWIKLAELYAQRQFWPMNLASCGNFGGCPFREVCSKSPKQRDVWIDADFVERRWDPLQIRGEV